MDNTVWAFLLALCTSASSLEIVGQEGTDVICSEGLSECTVEDWMLLMAEKPSVEIQSIKPLVKLSCSGQTCALCLAVDTELLIPPEESWRVERHSGSDQEETTEPSESVTLCYDTPGMMPVCKKVEFTVDRAALSHQKQAKLSLVMTQPDGFPFSSQVFVYPANQTPANHLLQKVITPSLNEVCSNGLHKKVPQCGVPAVHCVTKWERNHVELQLEGSNNRLPSMCVQFEKNGNCQSWNRTTIPLYSVTPCMCLQVWDEDILRNRLHLCPFAKTDILNISQRNMWDNVSVSVHLKKIGDLGEMLLWNLSAPCRLEGEVLHCHSESSCRLNVPRQELLNGTWRQDLNAFWVRTGGFNICDDDPQPSPCVLIKVKGAEHDFGPFCVPNTHRGHWTLLVFGVVLLICVTSVLIYCFHHLVKKWAWSWRRGGFIKVCRRGHVVLLSPPGLDDGASASACQLGSHLLSLGFSVAVDQWSRKEQCMMGPLPWLYSQLLKVSSMGGKVVLILNHEWLERTEEWMALCKDFELRQDDDELRGTFSPCHDSFTASLFLIQAEKQLDAARKRFLLVKLCSRQHQTEDHDRAVPEPLRSLPLFHLPSQTPRFLNELKKVEPRGGSRTKCSRKMQKSSDGLKVKTEESSNEQNTTFLTVLET